MSSESTPKPTYPWPEATAESETCLGCCHCGAIRFKATISPPLYPDSSSGSAKDSGDTANGYPVIKCGCSICVRNGYLLVYPFKKDVEFMGDSEQRLKTYLMASKVCPHVFCPDCGCSIGIDISAIAQQLGSEPRYALNVRMFKDIELDKLKYAGAHMSAKDMGPAYESPV